MMRPRREGDRLVIRTPAKVNLYLEVHGKRPDGYHELDMLNQAVDLHDTLRLRARPPGEGLRIHCDDPAVPTDRRNLVWRAWERLSGRAGGRGAEVWIEKRIPAGGGLGGGSATAAGALLGLCALWGLEPDAVEIHALATQVGSDVPFFLYGGRAICRGRGERVIPVSQDPPLWFVILWPGIAASTREIFDALETPLTGTRARLRISHRLLEAHIRSGTVFFNRLEAVAFTRWPRLEGARRKLEGEGALSARMSGSGSALYAAFLSRDHAQRVWRALRSRGSRTVYLAQGVPCWRRGPVGKERSRADH